MRLLEECRGSIDAVKRVGFELKEEDDKTSGFVNPNSSESQTSGAKPYHALCRAHKHMNSSNFSLKTNAGSILYRHIGNRAEGKRQNMSL